MAVSSARRGFWRAHLRCELVEVHQELERASHYNKIGGFHIRVIRACSVVARLYDDGPLPLDV